MSNMISSNGGFHIDLDPEAYGDTYKDPFIQDEDKLTIAELIPRILIERKSFLNVTEESLREEIDNPDHEVVPNDEGPESEEIPNAEQLESDKEILLSEGNVVDLSDPLEIFQQQKLDLSKSINSALNETSLSLDFVSLLISAVKPNVAKSTISPHLSKSAPLGSLNSDRLSTQTDEEDHKKKVVDLKDTAKVGHGWKLEALHKITTLFREASVNLNEQVLKERRYWNMINSVLSNDEVLFKTRDPMNNARAIGVKYGYGDSGSNFHDKGLAILRKDNQTGEISFNPITNANKLTSKIYRYIRIKILSEIDGDFMLTGQSVFENKFNGSSQPIINDIEKARFFLFEEDLFYQLTREAKSLINYNVSIISNKIIIEINNEIIEIESVVYDENNDDELNNYYQNINTYSSINNVKCQLVLNYFKIMLCCYYKYNLKLKQKIPTSLTKWKQSNSHPLILRPLLGNIRHELNLKNMQNILKRLLAKFKDSLECKLDVRKFANLEHRSENPFQKSIERPVSKFNIILKSKTKEYLKIDVELTTNEIFVNLIINLNIIKFKSEDEYSNNLNGVNVLQINFNDFHEIEECLDWSILTFVSG
ncbi:mediator of RNA polymerase II transcription subunit 17 [Scheffersomyces xylosifermentans]|uniref:mediator of RNA polymerase II transcription subunit 17 n=1 Tax=Scheffersomyces xylosifermentans TaxID=1304137 RepID=UPI00315D501B